MILFNSDKKNSGVLFLGTYLIENLNRNEKLLKELQLQKYEIKSHMIQI